MKKVIRLYYTYQLFFNLLIWLPIFYELQKQSGLNDSQIFGIQTIYYIFFCMLEIPTGYIADRFGYRISMRSGALVMTFSNILIIINQSYLSFLGHFVLIALARSLNSGAASAYIYEYLGSLNRLDIYKQTEGRARSIGLLGKVLCWPLVGFIMNWQPIAPYMITAIFTLIAFVSTFSLPNQKRQSDLIHQNWWKGVFQNLQRMVPILKNTPMLLLFMFQGMGIFVLVHMTQVNLFQPILKSKEFAITSFGTLMSVMTIMEALGAAQAHRIKKYFSDTSAVFVLTILVCLSIIYINYSGKLGTIIGFLLFSLFVGFSFPIQKQLVNDYIPDSRYRATLLSVESIFDRLVCSPIAYLMGAFISQGALKVFINWTLMAIASTSFLIYLFIRRARLRIAPS